MILKLEGKFFMWVINIYICISLLLWLVYLGWVMRKIVLSDVI